MYPGFIFAFLLQTRLSANDASGGERGYSEFFSSLNSYFFNDSLGFGLFEIVLSVSILFIMFVLRNFLIRKVFKFITPQNIVEKHHLYNSVVEGIRSPLSLFIFLFGLFLAISVYPLSIELRRFLWMVFQGSTLLIFVWAAIAVVDAFFEIFAESLKKKKSPLFGFFPLLKKSTRIVMVILGSLMAVKTMGYEIGPLLATLGLGGIALAYASQDTVANFFGSLCIVLDRPFQVGDWIEVNSKVNGTVTSIGLRSTRIRTFMATSLSIPNRVLANDTINNWSKMPKRRVKQVIGITYETKPEVIKMIVEDIRTLLQDDDDINQEFILVNFTGFGESALEILVYYFTKTTVWTEFLDVQQKINIQIIEIINKRGSSIAFPTRTLYFSDNLKNASS